MEAEATRVREQKRLIEERSELRQKAFSEKEKEMQVSAERLQQEWEFKFS